MNIEKTLEYLETVLSSESRIKRLEKIKSQLEKNRDYKIEQNKNFAKIINDELLENSNILLPFYKIYTSSLYDGNKFTNKRFGEIESILAEKVRAPYKKKHGKNKNFIWSCAEPFWSGFEKIIFNYFKNFCKVSVDCLLLNKKYVPFEPYNTDSILKCVKFFNLKDEGGFFGMSGTDICKKVLLESLPLINEYMTLLDEYYFNDYNEKCKDYIKFVTFNQLYEEKYQIVTDELQKEKENLKNLYDLEIVHPKYQNIIAISSFIDYFSTERCDNFVGVNGVYNLFETEKRLDRIIIQLENTTEQLEQIKKNQFAMYKLINEINKHTSVIINNLNSIGDRYFTKMNDTSLAAAKILKSQEISNLNSLITNELLEVSKEYHESIGKKLEFQNLLYIDPFVFGKQKITSKSYSKYH